MQDAKWFLSCLCWFRRDEVYSHGQPDSIPNGSGKLPNPGVWLLLHLEAWQGLNNNIPVFNWVLLAQLA